MKSVEIERPNCIDTHFGRNNYVEFYLSERMRIPNVSASNDRVKYNYFNVAALQTMDEVEVQM